jgi:thiol-disulfide isomerase/thioredoxin
MKNIILIISLITSLVACRQEGNKTESVSKNQNFEKVNENIPTLDYKGLKPWLNKKDNKIYVVNFWATWCKPCVKELPYFENVNEKYDSKNVEVILVSLDFPQKKETHLIPYVEKNNIQSRVLHLDDSNEQFWINDIAESWSGAIPATLIYNKDKRQFYEQSFSQEELENEIQTFLN